MRHCLKKTKRARDPGAKCSPRICGALDLILSTQRHTRVSRYSFCSHQHPQMSTYILKHEAPLAWNGDYQRNRSWPRVPPPVLLFGGCETQGSQDGSPLPGLRDNGRSLGSNGMASSLLSCRKAEVVKADLGRCTGMFSLVNDTVSQTGQAINKRGLVCFSSCEDPMTGDGLSLLSRERRAECSH